MYSSRGSFPGAWLQGGDPVKEQATGCAAHRLRRPPAARDPAAGALRALAFGLILPILLEGCGSAALPRRTHTVESPWQKFDDAKGAFDQVLPYKTSEDELKRLGFDPFTTPNIRILTYLDLMRMFLPNQSVRVEELDPGVRACLASREACHGYEAAPERTHSQRRGNVILDMFNFRRETLETGWTFRALIVVQDGVVVYKLWGGTPIVNQHDLSKNPLGPLQDSGDLLKDAVAP